MVAGGTGAALTPGLIASGDSYLAGFYGSTSMNPTFYGFADNFTIASPVAVPEPASLALMGIAAIGLLAALRRPSAGPS